jgi:hypothetical protein
MVQPGPEKTEAEPRRSFRCGSWRFLMHTRSLGIALGFVAVTLFGTGISFAQAPAEPAAKTEALAKPEGAEKHKEHGKHEKAHHEKKDGAEAGEAKVAK